MAAPPTTTIVARYGQFVRWLVADAVWRFKGRVAGVVAAGAAAIALQVQAVAAAIYYAHLFEKDKPFLLLGRTYETRESIGLLAAFAAAVALLLILSALLQYGARVGTLRLRRRYAEVCRDRVLGILGDAPRSLGPTPEPLVPHRLFMLARTDSMLCGRIFGIVINIVTPAISLAVALVALIVLNPLLTGLLLVLVSVCAAVLYRVSLGAAASSARTETAHKLAGRELRAAIDDRKRCQSPFAGKRGEASLEETDRWLDAYMRQRRAVDDSELVTNTFLAVVLATILVGLGIQAISSGEGWEAMAAYLVALRYALVTFRGVARTATTINRFYPQTRRYFEFILATREAAESPRAAGDADAYRLTVDRPRLPETLDTASLRPGARLCLITPVGLSRYTLPYFVGCLLGHDPEIARSVLDSASWIDDAANRDGRGRWVFLSEDDLAGLDDDGRGRLLDGLDDRLTVIVADPAAEGVGRYGEDLVAVCSLGGGGLAGLGSLEWFGAHREQVATEIAEAVAAAGGVDDPDEDDD